jgi:lipid A 3-O-deacylase
MQTRYGFGRPLGLVLLAVFVAQAQEPGHFTVLEENDGIVSHKDRYYTQGLQLSYLGPALAGGWVDRGLDALGRWLPMYAPQAQAQRRVSWIVLAQTEFTPEKLDLSVPDPHDRPYAAWLYTGAHALQENDRRSLHDLDVQLGVVGPAALGREAQDGYHALVGFHKAQGWSHQLHDRLAAQFSYDFARRLVLPLGGGYAVDALPGAGASLGNVYRYAQASLLVRAGNALDADYGPEHIRPALSGNGFADWSRLGPASVHFYFYAGAQARYMEYDLLLDGAGEVAPGAQLGRFPFVTDLVAGASLFYRRALRADFVTIRRSKQFDDQHGPEVYGGVNLGFAL